MALILNSWVFQDWSPATGSLGKTDHPALGSLNKSRTGRSSGRPSVGGPLAKDFPRADPVHLAEDWSQHHEEHPVDLPMNKHT